MWKYSMCLLFSCPKDNNKYQQSFFYAVIYPTPQVCTVTRKPYLAYHVTGISQAAEADLQKTDRVIITAKQIRRITREEGCVWADQRADRHQERQ